MTDSLSRFPQNTRQVLPGEKPRRGPLAELNAAFTGIRRGETIAGYLFVLPNLLGFTIFGLFPIAFAAYIALTDWNLSTAPQYIGLKNFETMLTDRLFWLALKNSFYYTFGAVPIGVFAAFWLALLMNRKIRGMVIFRTAAFLPQITLTVAVAVVWSWIYHPEFGLINFLLKLIGVDGPRWIYSSAWAMPAVIIMSNWQGIGFATLILLAGLQSVPEELHEAASIDGAGGWQKLRFVTVPLLSPAIFFVIVTSLIGAFQSFDQFYILTRGGPANATTPLTLYIFQNGFQFFKMGYGAALSFVLFVIILIITFVQWRVANRWVYGIGDGE